MIYFWLNRPFWYKIDLLIDLNQSNVNYSIKFISKIFEFNQKWSHYSKNCWFWSSFLTFSIKLDHFWSNLTIFDINLNIKSNSDMDFENRIEYGHGFWINIVATIDRTHKFGSKKSIKSRFEYDLDLIRFRSNFRPTSI